MSFVDARASSVMASFVPALAEKIRAELRAVEEAAEEIGRQKGLEEAAQVADECGSRYAGEAKRNGAKGCATHIRALIEDPLHPNGKCECCGEGTCAWCQKHTPPPDPED